MELESPNEKNERLSRVEVGMLSKDYFEEQLKKILFPKHPSDWKDAPAKISEDKLEILNRSVMERWEEHLMRELAEIATSKGGTILEVGFGLGISAGYIQQHEIVEHFIIEANSDVFRKLEEFAQQAKHKVTPIFGFWQEVVDSLPSESFDGILFDPAILSEDDYKYGRTDFVKHAYRLLKKGGVYTEYTAMTELTPAHSQFLNKLGFTEISAKLCSVNPPKSCPYWDKPVMIAPTIIK
jgi:guanidinoacetate N-methyltransferase